MKSQILKNLKLKNNNLSLIIKNQNLENQIQILENKVENLFMENLKLKTLNSEKYENEN